MLPCGSILSKGEVASIFLAKAIDCGETNDALRLLGEGANPNTLGDQETPFFIRNTFLAHGSWTRARPVVCMAISNGNVPVLKRLLDYKVDLSTKPPFHGWDLALDHKIFIILCLLIFQCNLFPISYISSSIGFFILMVPFEGYLWRTVQDQSLNARYLQIEQRIAIWGVLLLALSYLFPQNTLLNTLLYSYSIRAYLLRRVLLSFIISTKVLSYVWAEIRKPPQGTQALLAMFRYKGDAELMATMLLSHIEDLGDPTEHRGSYHAVLVWAVARGYHSIVQLLVERGISPSLLSLEFQPRTILDLAKAIANGNGEHLALLVDPETFYDASSTDPSFDASTIPQPVDPIFSSPRNAPLWYQPLVVASARGDFATVQVLLRHGAHTQQILDEALIQCIGNCNSGADHRLSIVEALLARGASATSVDGTGRSALSLSCEFRIAHVLTRTLLARGAGSTLASVDSQGRTALHHAVWRHDESTGTLGLLLELGAPANVLDKQGWSPLWYAANRGTLGALSALLGYGAIVDLAGCTTTTPLMEACRHGSLPKTAMLLAHGADVNARIGDDTPLSLALVRGWDEDRSGLVGLLLDRGALAITPMPCTMENQPLVKSIWMTPYGMESPWTVEILEAASLRGEIIPTDVLGATVERIATRYDRLQFGRTLEALQSAGGSKMASGLY